MSKILVEELEELITYRDEISKILQDRISGLGEVLGFKYFAELLAIITGEETPERLEKEYNTLTDLTNALEYELARTESVLASALPDYQQGGWKKVLEVLQQLTTTLVPVTVNLSGATYATEGLFIYKIPYDIDFGYDYYYEELIYECRDRQDYYTFEVPYGTRIKICPGYNIDDYNLKDIDTNEFYNISTEEFPESFITNSQIFSYEVIANYERCSGTYSTLSMTSTATGSEPLTDYRADEVVSEIPTGAYINNGIGRPLNGTYSIYIQECYADVTIDGYYYTEASPDCVSNGEELLCTDWDGFTIGTLYLHNSFYYTGESWAKFTVYLRAQVFALKLEGDYTGVLTIQDGTELIPITDTWFDGEYTYLLSESWNEEHPQNGTSGDFKLYYERLV